MNKKKPIGRAMQWLTRASASGVLLLACSTALAGGACLVTAAELETATGRAFGDGQESKTVMGTPMCIYVEKARPQRKLTIDISTTSNARKQFESRIRLLQMRRESIELQGVGDGAYFNGTAAGVLTGDRLIGINSLRRASDPKIAPEKVVQLLEAVLKRAGD